ncbi:MAG: EamA family transporter [Ignavibacteria bacterium]|nr:EamA family transporter [Ignavibacteria bacterium]
MKDLRGFFLILAAAFFWGLSATFAKLALTDRVGIVLIAQTRVTFSFLIIMTYFLLAKPSVLKIRVSDLWRFAFVGVVGVAGSNFMYYTAIKEGTVATAILLQYTAPIMVMGFAVATREERLTTGKVIGAFLSLAGCVLVVGGSGLALLEVAPPGFVSGVASAICFALFTVSTKRLLHRYTVWTVTTYALGFASAFWIVLNPPWTVLLSGPPAATWGALIALAVASVLVPYTLYFSGLQFIESSRAIIASTSEPVFAIGSAALLLGEHLQAGQALGTVCVIAAIIIVKLNGSAKAMQENHSIAGNTDAA